MAYKKQNFVNKSTILTAEHLEHMEDGIYKNSVAIENIKIPESGEWIATRKLVGGDTIYIPEQKVSGGIWNNLQMNFQLGFEYDVTVNGVVYYCTANEYDGGVILGNNPSLSLNIYPFCISWSGEGATSGFFFKNSDISSPVTLKVTDHASYQYNQLPEEYLPSSIATKEYVNNKIAELELKLTEVLDK